MDDFSIGNFVPNLERWHPFSLENRESKVDGLFPREA